MNFTPRIPYRLRSFWIALSANIVLVSIVFAQEAVPGAPIASSLAERYPAGSIHSIEIADQALQEVNRDRSSIERLFEEDERACYPKFLATSCLQDAKERRRRALARVRPIEVEANGFKRHARVVERDKALAEKLVKEELEAPQRNKEQREKEAEILKKSMDTASKNTRTSDADESLRMEVSGRVADHEAKLKREETEEIANAKKRAENIDAYERKVRDAENRQREIANKKSEK